MILINLYRKLQLNLGIKRRISQLFVDFDNSVLFSLYTFLQRVLFGKIVRHYGADYRWNEQWSQNLDTSTHNLGFGTFHYSLIRNLRPKRVLCIGSMYGFIPYMMALACSENKIGIVDFVDAAYDIEKKDSTHFYGVGFWKKIDISHHFKYLLKESNCLKTYIMDSELFADKYSHKYDYIYFDGDHSLSGAIRDLKRFWPRLNHGGFLCFHDIKVTKGPDGTKMEFWKLWKLLKKYPNKFEIGNPYAALGIIQKIKETPLPDLHNKVNRDEKKY